MSISCVCVLITQSCLSLCDPIDCSPPGSSVRGDSPGKNTGVGCHALLQGIFPTQGLTRSAPGKSGLHGRGKGERVIALKSGYRYGFPRGSAGKESTCNVRDLGSTPREQGLGRERSHNRTCPCRVTEQPLVSPTGRSPSCPPCPPSPAVQALLPYLSPWQLDSGL